MTQSQLEPKLKDRVAIISGAGSGIGRAAALRLAGQGAKVCLLDIKENRVKHVAEQITESGGNALVVEVDVSKPSEVQAAIKQLHNQWKRVDIVFANAGINGTVAPIEDLSPEDWDQTLSVDLKGTFLLTKYSIPYLKEHGGSIIITSSINGNRKFSGIGMSAYSSAKAGQVAFMKMAALELARYHIRVNAICPGAIKTNISQSTHKTPELKEVEIPVKYPEGSQPLEHKAGEPEQVADLVLFLASEESNHITGTEIYIDGAESLL
jgi:NAD(P)-dependent dehydrogenase (short-subunit alcohol dehydrogenase family)